MTEPRLLTTTQTAGLLGVKTATVYAYVSRGILHRQAGADRRSSAFDRREVEELAGRSRPATRTRALDLVIDTSITRLDPDGALHYRGSDATVLARTRSFEQVAELLWAADEVSPWESSATTLRYGRRAQRAMPPRASVADRLLAIAAAAGSTDPLRDDLRPVAVTGAARSLITAMVEALPDRSPLAGRTIAHRLWSKLAAAGARHRPGRGQVGVLNAALVLCADHELAASTLAARIAASVRADPYLVVLTGLATTGGARHGRSAGTVEAALHTMSSPAAVGPGLSGLLHTGGSLPGFGHAVYRAGDPRATALLDLLDATGGTARRRAVVHRVLELTTDRGAPPPNVDFALAAMSYCLGLVPGSAEAVFGLARCAGLIAHALEEYPHGLRYRARALYTGPAGGTADRD